jgi:flagellar biosynthesis protein FlhB
MRRALLAQSTEGGEAAVANTMAVVVNPTHLAVGLEYHLKEDIPVGRPPRVVAKGSGRRAQEIVRRAHLYRIPVIRNVSLARNLFKVQLGRPVPAELFDAMEVLLAELELLARKAAQEKTDERDAATGSGSEQT